MSTRDTKIQKHKINNYRTNGARFSNLNLSRRSFLKIGALTTISGAILSCNKEENPTEPTIDPPIPIITGPTELTIPSIGKGVLGTFDSSGTIAADKIYWQLIKPISFAENIENKGSSPNVNISFPIPGENEVRLISDNSAGRTMLTHKVKVNPPMLPENNYDLPMLLIMLEGGKQSAFYTLDIRTMEFTRIFSSDKIYGYPSWEPSGQRMVFVSSPGVNDTDAPHKIMTYNFLNGSFKTISNNTQGLAWSPKWSPQGDWIAYLDDSRSENRAVDVIALVRPDGSEQFYLDGLGQSNRYSGQNISWDPEGTRLAAGGNAYKGYALSIYDKLFNGSPTCIKMPTEEQKERYYDSEADTFIKAGMSKDIFMQYFLAGANGIAWSPNDENIAYTANFGLGPNDFQAILLSSADGSGDIQTIARCLGGESDGQDSEFWFPIEPTWTPDGLNIFFIAEVFNHPHLYRYNLVSKQYEEVSLPIPGLRPKRPTLYG